MYSRMYFRYICIKYIHLSHNIPPRNENIYKQSVEFYLKGIYIDNDNNDKDLKIIFKTIN